MQFGNVYGFCKDLVSNVFFGNKFTFRGGMSGMCDFVSEKLTFSSSSNCDKLTFIGVPSGMGEGKLKSNPGDRDTCHHT